MRFFILLISFLSIQSVQADCTTTPPLTDLPTTGKAGEIRMSNYSNATTAIQKMMYCDGTNWQELPGSIGGACTSTGGMKLISGEMYSCRAGYYWRFDSTGTTNGPCTKAGEVKWNTATSRIEFCNGTDWRVVDPVDNTADTFNFNQTTGNSWDSSTTQTEQVTGFSGGMATFTFNTPSCGSPYARVCATSACTTYSSSTTSDGSAWVPNMAFIRIAFTTQGAPNAACSVTVSVGGVTTTASATTGATDTTVTYNGNFTEVRSATQSTLYTSNIVRTSGHSGVSISLSDSSLGGNPEYRICSDSACATVLTDWTNSAGTLPIASFIQLRATSGANNVSLRRIQVLAGTGAAATWNLMTSTCPSTTTLASGATLTCTCPANYVSYGGSIYGVGNYRQNSNVCTAALHAGVIDNATGGSLTIKGNTSGTPPGTCASFAASTANGVTSSTAASGASIIFNSMPDVCN
ncbi:hypothetical protein AZI86_01765 [Bdellovibrio bacteriovorus]|uniref:LCCL domain-containing protein n=1 Tax=Bdellovibrio bacteriovorus TaxID=959 RepID=A0A150WN75_BDEBC|nr:LCCL domain-containing protein [Bdellovibrio bacteriovorus]KYG65826.1 hypothetical protein AZI86_01765 [Bdellovibrio bacteriovorus]